MKRALVVAVCLLFVLPLVFGFGSASAQSAPARNYASPIAQVNTVPIQPNGVTATMLFQATGAPNPPGTRATSTGFGFDWRLSGRYYSLVYDLASVDPASNQPEPLATQPGANRFGALRQPVRLADSSRA